MKTILNKETNYSLHNSDNYKAVLDADMGEILMKISSLFIDYCKMIHENIRFKNQHLLQFTIFRGLDTIVHVFNYILLYTNNVDVAYFHCQKAFYFYIEFVGQISDEEKIFLQLSTRDATIYVYKKTIYELNIDFKKSHEKQQNLTSTSISTSTLNLYMEIYKTVLLKIIRNSMIDLRSITMLEDLYGKLNKHHKFMDQAFLVQFSKVIDHLFYKIINIELFFELISAIIKKTKKNIELLESINAKIMSTDEFCEQDEGLIACIINV